MKRSFGLAFLLAIVVMLLMALDSQACLLKGRLRQTNTQTSTTTVKTETKQSVKQTASARASLRLKGLLFGFSTCAGGSCR